MKRYKNESLFVWIFMGLYNVFLFIVLIVMLCNQDSNEKMIDYIFKYFAIISLLSINLLIYLLKEQYYLTYIGEDRIIQKLFCNKKEIFISEIKTIYFIDSLAIFSKTNFDLEINNYVATKNKRQIKKSLKKEINVTMSMKDKTIELFIIKNCSDIKKVNVGSELRSFMKELGL